MKYKFDHQRLYFTADLHLGHANIMRYCNRPYKTVDEMNADILNGIREVSSRDAVLFIIGDVVFSGIDHNTLTEFAKCLNGFQKVYMLRGNHDPSNMRNKLERYANRGNLSKLLPLKISWLADSIIEIFVEDDEMEQDARMILCHYPLLSWNASYHGSWHLFGHVHGALRHPSFNALDVGVDCHEYKPISYSKVKEIITRQNLTKTHLY